MRLLLDTHALIWFVLNDTQLSAMATAAITDPANDVPISPATDWEIAIKVAKGQLDLYAPFDDFMARGIVGNDFEILPNERSKALLRLIANATGHKIGEESEPPEEGEELSDELARDSDLPVVLE